MQGAPSRASSRHQRLEPYMRAMHHFEKLGAGGSGVINRFHVPNNTIDRSETWQSQQAG